MRCFQGYTAYFPGLDTYNDDPTYTKCLKIGNAWDPDYNFANFSVYGDTSTALVQVYSTSQATYLAERLDPRLLNACRSNTTLSSGDRCPWETIWDDNHLPSDMGALSTNLMYVHASQCFLLMHTELQASFARDSSFGCRKGRSERHQN